ncbi:hypothetical protein COV56_02185 [Candidatus Kuenenbacteria bacterium CG11_big_fil_rev_8_21_14_0_20_37_9]|uniref:Uncharacterized protein n=1 Tax=Candidatus Kuenenbacteria bacterium CG08_land_8_20_14_0_20_37_23 TaxID=1974617 RepID=A0A2M6XSR7_9BACT|nr:MAG: hypothetical protein COV56_02185 [Candidatus Kuenenbacteria bacterium CG11_big_fil_rev_8_21_14_0_20_37_9]PIU10680.1 MAG: hypothetical protein COT27_01985 [Candidatus Kuenenbacteria bacterium CG08_land_8_20_14_0_20_37_23]
MPNILPTETSVSKLEFKTKRRVSFLGVLLTVILAVVIIILGERIMFDLNRAANPMIESTISRGMSADYYMRSTDDLIIEKSNLSGTNIYYPRKQSSEYKMYKLLIHSAFVLPIFLLMFLLYYWLNLKKRNENWFVVVWGYMAASIWFLLHLIGEVGKYVVNQYKNAAIYIILVFLALILTTLAVFIQKKKVEN